MKAENAPNRRERGQSLTEMAVSMVVLLMLLAGVVDLGRALFTFISMRDAAEEGMVYASVYPFPCDHIRTRILDSLDAGFDPEITIRYHGVDCQSLTTAGIAYGDGITITLTEPNFQIATPMMGTLLGRQNLTIRASITGTMLRPVTTP